LAAGGKAFYALVMRARRVEMAYFIGFSRLRG